MIRIDTLTNKIDDPSCPMEPRLGDYDPIIILEGMRTLKDVPLKKMFCDLMEYHFKSQFSVDEHGLMFIDTKGTDSDIYREFKIFRDSLYKDTQRTEGF